MLCAKLECSPWTAISQVVLPDTGPRASGPWRGRPLLPPVGSSPTQGGGGPGGGGGGGSIPRHSARAVERFTVRLPHAAGRSCVPHGSHHRVSSDQAGAID